MTMAEKIKYYREQLDWSQEELGKRLDPPVNKAAVQKWEKGTVENIKRTYIQQMADKFRITACELLSFEDSQQDPDKENVCNLINKCYGKEAYNLVEMYLDMNDEGRNLASTLISNLHSNPVNCEKRDSQKMA